MKHVVLIIPGILHQPGDLEGWPDRAATWLLMRGIPAQPCEYWAGALTRRFRQQHRAEKIAKRVGYFESAGFRVHLKTHSNGGDIACRVCQLRGQPGFFQRPIASAHLYAPAAHEHDIAAALAAGNLERVIVHGSAGDDALKWGRRSHQLFGWAGLGYGSAGLDSSELVRVFPDRARQRRYPDFEHSTWHEAEMFEATMQDFAADFRSLTASP